MKFKIGDKVRVFGKGKVKEIIAINEVFGYRTNDNNYYIDEELEPVTNDYITTKDFIKEVEKLGYHLTNYQIGEYIENNENDLVAYISHKYTRAIQTFGLSDEILFDLLIKYAKTPIEFREEPKKYTLQCPLTKEYLCVKSTRSKNPVWIHANNFKENNQSMPKYTQEEIDNLPNQEFIKTLIKKEVEND